MKGVQNHPWKRKRLISLLGDPFDFRLRPDSNTHFPGQMRLDGFFCEYKSDDKFNFLKRLHDKGVRNIEMESTCFASMTYRAGVK
ncbi:hypothetical protein OSTOST_09082, partial [Ostertagia ostertagi]